MKMPGGERGQSSSNGHSFEAALILISGAMGLGLVERGVCLFLCAEGVVWKTSQNGDGKPPAFILWRLGGANLLMQWCTAGAQWAQPFTRVCTWQTPVLHSIRPRRQVVQQCLFSMGLPSHREDGPLGPSEWLAETAEGEERKGTRWVPLLTLVLWFHLAPQRPSSSTCHQDPGPHSLASSLSVHTIPWCQVFLSTSGPLHMLALLLGMLFPFPLCFPPVILQISIKYQAAFLGPSD